VSLKKLGRYDLVRVLGKGAMGVVYEARDPNLERRVAIKTVKVENLSEEAAAEYEARFRTEARSAARLQHPNIVSVYDSDRDGDVAFLVMEYIQGDDLKHHLDRGVRYSLEQSLKMIRDLLAALDYAHKAGIVHRDIKPANLLIEPGGRVKLTDFGVARIQDSGEATRTQGSMVGTLKYMAPEQVQGLKIDSRADLFSVGVVLYQLLTDKRPFDGDNDFSIIHQIIGHTPPPPSSFNARLPPAIDAVVARALAKDRENRFATARDFASALQSAIRRAEDSTVVPPADPFKKADGSVSSKGTVPSMVGTGTSGTSGTTGTTGTSGTATVTQELELVYWKDIKDSTESEEFEGFLQQFPAGIYADLARRRLRKLAGGSSSPEQTVLMPRVGDGTVPVYAADLDATRVRSDSSIPMAASLIAPASPPAFGSAAALA
jgi:serine/threonine protein kinase